MPHTFALIGLFFASAWAPPDTPTPPSAPERPTPPSRPDLPGNMSAEQAIRRLLDRQQDAWNSGDIEGFMDGYARSQDLRFVSGDTVKEGWLATLRRYQNRYPDAEAMGSLTFHQVDVTRLGPEAAMAFGRWGLRGTGKNREGTFTLILRRGDDGWRIVHDHTSTK